MIRIWLINRDSKYEYVCKILVVKNLGKISIFFKKFWNYGIEEFSFDVSMEDVYGRI